MSRHALEVLEFARVLERVAKRTGSALAGERIRALAPSDDAASIRRELARVGATMRFAEEKPGWGMPAVPDVRRPLRGLTAEGAVLEPVELYGDGRPARLLARACRGARRPGSDATPSSPACASG